MYIRVHVSPGAKRESFKQITEDSFVAAVKEPAMQNHANRRILELMGAHLGLNPKQIRIISGHRSPGKILSVPDPK